MRGGTAILVLALAAAGGCSSPGGTPPSLAPRAAEAIDPRVPVQGAVNSRPVSPALAGRLAQLVALARQGDAAFRPLAGRAQQLAGAAGAPQTEAWVVAQEALSAAVAARGPTARALGDADALAAEALQTQGGLAPADLAAIQGAAAEIGSIDARHAETIAAIQRRLGI